MFQKILKQDKFPLPNEKLDIFYSFLRTTSVLLLLLLSHQKTSGGDGFFQLQTIQQTKSLEDELKKAGLIDIQTINNSIKVNLKYSTTDNFMKTDVYGDLTKAYMQPAVAEKLNMAQKNLQKEHPTYKLVIYDAVRPAKVQQKMRDIVKGTPQEKYVAAPSEKGSLHNYGCAIDLSVVDGKGKALDMGTAFDHLGKLAQPKLESQFLASGELTQSQIDNRLILRKAMTTAGFTVLPIERRHFNAFSMEYVREHYKKIP